MKSIIIAADIVPTKSNYKLFENGDIDSLIGKELRTKLNNASFSAMNLEVPLADKTDPIRKCGPCLISPTNTILGISKINPHFMTLANNHILDQGYSGLTSTIDILRKYNISYAGAGNNIEEAKKPFIISIEGIKFGFYCCTEHEFSVATDMSPGANPYDPLVSFDDVQALKSSCDYIIVLYHGGKEHYRYPSPMLRRIFHKFADVGADLVIAQHTHCIGCKEEYKGCTLVYGQGNFLFDYSDSDFWKTSLLIQINLDNLQIEYIPIVKEENRVRLASNEEAVTILEGFCKRSEEILKDGFIEERYEKFASEIKREYYYRFSGGFTKNLIMRGLNKLSSHKMIDRFYKEDSRIGIQNVLECEAHRELAITVMKQMNDD